MRPPPPPQPGRYRHGLPKRARAVCLGAAPQETSKRPPPKPNAVHESFLETASEPASTFAVDASTAGFRDGSRALLKAGVLPPPGRIASKRCSTTFAIRTRARSRAFGFMATQRAP
jgi:hypothetical protein